MVFETAISFLQRIETHWLLLVVLTCLIYLAALMLGRWLKRALRVPLNPSYQVFAMAFAIVGSAWILHVEFPGRKEISLVAVIAAAFPINALLYRFLWPLYGYPGEKARIPPFLPQVVSVLLVASVFFTGLAVLYHVTLPGLLAGSGVVAIILGLALQDTLGNIFAGFGLQAAKMFKAGDWLIIDGRHLEVIEVHWHSTRFRTYGSASFNIPNNQLAKATIVNLSYPTSIHGARVELGIDYRTPPDEVIEALIKATSAANGVLEEPAPEVFLIGFGESEIKYAIDFWLNDGRRYLQIIHAVRTNCWYELSRRGIPFAFPVRIVELTQKPQEESRESDALTLLARQPLFSDLGEKQIGLLANSAIHLQFGKGETIIRQGDPGKSMFILAKGVAEVFAKQNGQSRRVGDLAPGDCLGEMSFLTGETRGATVVATSHCEVVEIEKEVMANLLRQDPHLAEKLSETVLSRRSKTEAELARVVESDVAVELGTTKESFLNRLREFFQL